MRIAFLPRLTVCALAGIATACAGVETGPRFPAPPSPERTRNLSRADAPALVAEFGKPDFVRKEKDSELWRYDAQNCRAFFFLYRDGQALRLRYMETEPRGPSDAPDPSCLSRVKAENSPPLS